MGPVKTTSKMTIAEATTGEYFFIHHLIQIVVYAVMQGFSNFWCYGAHDEIDHDLRSPTIKQKKNKRIARGALGLRTEHFENHCCNAFKIYFLILLQCCRDLAIS